jgi:hypothetical protein
MGTLLRARTFYKRQRVCNVTGVLEESIIADCVDKFVLFYQIGKDLLPRYMHMS